MKPALEATGLEHVFQSVVSGDDVYRGRPDPEAYLYAAQQLGRPSVRCVVIGNSNQVGAGARYGPLLPDPRMCCNVFTCVLYLPRLPFSSAAFSS